MIRVEHLRKQFGTVTAVNGVTFTAENGAITGLLGPNGAGKTTTLRMLYAVMRPDSGGIKVDDVDAIADPHEAQGRLGVLPDGFGLYPRLTAREYLEYFGELHGMSGTALRARTKELLDLLDMNAIADRRTAGFSHGERTKVGLAPLHAWLPDAHAEGPTPISAVLSGLLLNVALYALLRLKLLLAGSPLPPESA